MNTETTQTNTLGIRIKTARLKKNYSIEEVSKLVGVPASTYRDWENGRSVTGEPYQKIAQALGMTVYDVLGISEVHEKDELFNLLSKIEEIVKEIKRRM